MAYIYKIVNDINEKIQIGKTEFSIEKRFKEHCRDRVKENCNNRPLYRAMNKYGIEHFHIELIEKTDNPEEREIYWINYYNSYHNGYNATLGGDGRKSIDYDEVVRVYQKNQNIRKTAKELNISCDHCSDILKEKEVTIKSSGDMVKEKSSKEIEKYSLEGKYLETQESCMAAARSLDKVNSHSRSGAASHISDVCKNKRKTAQGFKWKFKQ